MSVYYNSRSTVIGTNAGLLISTSTITHGKPKPTDYTSITQIALSDYRPPLGNTGLTLSLHQSSLSEHSRETIRATPSQNLINAPYDHEAADVYERILRTNKTSRRNSPETDSWHLVCLHVNPIILTLIFRNQNSGETKTVCIHRRGQSACHNWAIEVSSKRLLLPHSKTHIILQMWTIPIKPDENGTISPEDLDDPFIYCASIAELIDPKLISYTDNDHRTRRIWHSEWAHYTTMIERPDHNFDLHSMTAPTNGDEFGTFPIR